MANTNEVIRLMRHAADLLDQQDPSATVESMRRIAGYGDRDAVTRAERRAVAEHVAISMAATTLRMVAAALDEPEPTAESTTVQEGR